MKSRLSSLCSFVTGFLSQVYLHWVADELKLGPDLLEWDSVGSLLL